MLDWHRRCSPSTRFLDLQMKRLAVCQGKAHFAHDNIFLETLLASHKNGGCLWPLGSLEQFHLLLVTLSLCAHCKYYISQPVKADTLEFDLPRSQSGLSKGLSRQSVVTYPYHAVDLLGLICTQRL